MVDPCRLSTQPSRTRRALSAGALVSMVLLAGCSGPQTASMAVPAAQSPDTASTAVPAAQSTDTASTALPDGPATEPSRAAGTATGPPSAPAAASRAPALSAAPEGDAVPPAGQPLATASPPADGKTRAVQTGNAGPAATPGSGTGSRQKDKPVASVRQPLEAALGPAFRLASENNQAAPALFDACRGLGAGEPGVVGEQLLLLDDKTFASVDAQYRQHADAAHAASAARDAAQAVRRCRTVTGTTEGEGARFRVEQTVELVSDTGWLVRRTVQMDGGEGPSRTQDAFLLRALGSRFLTLHATDFEAARLVEVNRRLRP